MGMRLGEHFLQQKGVSLSQFGCKPDPGRVEFTGSGNIVFYHYTKEEHLERILSPDSGLYAWRQVDVCPNPPEELTGCFLTEGFLEPLPMWLTDCPYFGDLGIEMVKQYIGNILLRIELPRNDQGLYVADYAHVLEEKHFTLRGTAPLQLGYDFSTGKEITQAYVHSYIPATQYESVHVSPVMQAVRKGAGVVIPSDYIRLSEEQPLR